MRPLIVTEYPPLRIELNGKAEDATGAALRVHQCGAAQVFDDFTSDPNSSCRHDGRVLTVVCERIRRCCGDHLNPQQLSLSIRWGYSGIRSDRGGRCPRSRPADRTVIVKVTARDRDRDKDGNEEFGRTHRAAWPDE